MRLRLGGDRPQFVTFDWRGDREELGKRAPNAKTEPLKGKASRMQFSGEARERVKNRYDHSMFDNVCRFLAETFSTDFATWLLGEAIELTQLSPSKLSLEPIRADALILLQSDEVVLHVEFQTQPKPDIPFRIADYRLRVYRRFPQKRMQQVVIYLQQTDSELTRQTAFTLETMRHEFGVIRLWEQSVDEFLSYPGLLPFAVLSQTDDRTQVLQQVAQEIDRIADQRMQSNVTASTFILAGLVLETEVIGQILRRDIMQESVTYQAIKVEGREEKCREVASNLLQEGIALEVIARVTDLSIEQIQQLQSTVAQDSAEL